MILLLGEHAKKLEPFLIGQGERVQHTNDPLPNNLPRDIWAISFGYRCLIPKHILAQLERPAINLHISLLPWNRGADPNLWSWLENTPKGVTIHEIDEGVDTGPILAQTHVEFRNIDGAVTLRSSYDVLMKTIVELFKDTFCNLVWGGGTPQLPGAGSYHKSADKHAYAMHMTKGWDTPVLDLIGLACYPKNNGGAHEVLTALPRPLFRKSSQSLTVRRAPASGVA